MKVTVVLLRLAFRRAVASASAEMSVAIFFQMLPECDGYAAASRSDIQYLDLLVCIVEDDLLDQFFCFRTWYQDGRVYFELKAVEIGRS
jgi:hypothetical protein